MMSPMSAEATVSRNYIDWLVSIPWQERTEDKLDIAEAERILDEDHYGLEKVKERILEYLAVRTLVTKLKGPILCFVGPPGVGKTSLARSIARAMGRKFVRMSLAGPGRGGDPRPSPHLHRGDAGKIMQQIRRRGPSTRLPARRGGQDVGGFPRRPVVALLEVSTRAEQHLQRPLHRRGLRSVRRLLRHHREHAPRDPGPLQDRMEIIRLHGYTEVEKLHIAHGTSSEEGRGARAIEGEGGLQRQGGPPDHPVLHREAGVRSLERRSPPSAARSRGKW